MTAALLLFIAAAEAPPVAAVEPSAPRLLLGVGLQFGGGEETNTDGAGGLGLYGRIGVELTEQWGVGLELSGATFVLDTVSYGRASITADFTPVDWVTFAVGPSYRDDFAQGSNNYSEQSMLGAVRIDFHFGAVTRETGREALTVGLLGDYGVDVAGTNPSSKWGIVGTWGLYVDIGWARY